MRSKHPPSGPVHRSRGYPGAKSLQGRLLGLLDGLYQRLNLRRRPPQIHGARQVAAVVAEYNTQVQDDQLVFLQALLGGLGVRQRGAGPEATMVSKEGPEAPLRRMR